MTPENLLPTGAGMLCLALGAGLLPGERQRRLAAAGLLVLGLAIGAWHAGSPPGGGLTPPGRLGQGFLVGNGGLLLLGAGLGGVAALRAEPGPLRPAARLLTVAGIMLLGWVLAAFLGTAGPARALGAALAIGLAGLTLAAAGRALVGGPVGILIRRLAPPPLVPASVAGPRAWLSVVLVATAAAALGPHAAVVLGGPIAAAWAGYLTFHRAGRRPPPVAPVLTLLLVPVYWLLATVAGPVGLATSALSQVPLSPAAELLVSPALLLGAWATAGLWPLQRQLPGALVAPVGALLLARVILPLAPGGLEYWQPLLVPLVLLGLWNAASYGRWPLALSGAGFLGLVGGPPDLAAGASLLAGGLALELCSSAAVPPRVGAVVHVALWPLVTWAALRVAELGLRGEVVYTALGLFGLAVIVAARRERALIPPAGASIFAD